MARPRPGGCRLTAEQPGTWGLKPRGQGHALGNAGDDPCEIIAVISPGGFEDFSAGPDGLGDRERFAAINREFDIKFESMPALCARCGLTFPQL